MKLVKYLLFPISILFLIPVYVLSVPAEREDFKVNSDNGNYEQTDPRIAVAPDGSFVIVWIDKREGENNVYLQRYNADGYEDGGNIKINDDVTTSWQAQPALEVGISGQYGVVWQDFRTDGYPSNPDIYFQPLDSLSIPIDTNRNLTPGYQNWMRENPDISLSAWGAGVVVWADYLNGNWDIYGQLIGPDGSLIGSSFKVNDDAGSSQQHSPKVATSAEGWFVVTWYDNRSGNDDIFVQRYEDDGAPIGVNVKINTDGTTKRQTLPDITTDGAGNFTVVWVDYRNGSYPDNPDIYAAKYSKDLTQITGNLKLNTDGTERAQKYPAISADRMGNVGLVWADSTSLSWEIVGQMIDVDGVVREVDFTANSSGDSTKIKPQIALSGTHRYVTWVDRRSGNYDIYASITKYNDPKLLISPQSLTFEMQQGGGVPPAQYISVEDVGYNRLGYKVFSYNNWISCSPSAGETPDSFAVTITSDTLPYGTYTGAIMVIDTINHDSTNIIAVRLDVKSAILSVTPDTVEVVAMFGMDTTIYWTIHAVNTNAGELSCTAYSDAAWINIPNSPLTTPADFIIEINPISLSAGNYNARIIVEAANALNSPDTVVVMLMVRDDIPFITVDPDSIFAASNLPAEIDTFITIQNIGGGVTNWTAVSAASWLLIDRMTGTDNDTIRLSIDNSQLTPGLWNSYIDITDSNAVNINSRCYFQLEYIEDFVDTVRIEPANVFPEEEGVTAISLNLTSTIESIFLPIRFDTSAIIVDSLIFGAGLPLYMEKHTQINNSKAQFTLELSSIAPGMYMAGGDYLLAEIFFTSRNTNITTTFDTLCNDSLYPFIKTFSGSTRTPVTISGQIIIGEPTPVEDYTPGILPEKVELHNNYPNPFNSGTNIQFELPRRANIRLDIYNILGQRIKTLINKQFPAGLHIVSWDGTNENNWSAPSGIYFYRLSGEDFSIVKKMILLQ
ncbi:MAG: T9SS type A sorting domain-containing protein [bacterium]